METLGPDSLTWQLVGDWRMLAGGGRALLLQVAHPAVGAAVAEFSDYKRAPWKRLERTLHATFSIVYGGDTAAAAAKRLRAMHERIAGTDFDGRRYHALDREAFHFVHATLFETTLTICRRFVRALSDEECEQLYREFRVTARLMGIDEADMPPDLTSFFRYYERALRTLVGDNEVVRELLEYGQRPARPPWLPLPDTVWPLLRWPIFQLVHLVTVGTLPASVRERWSLRWTFAHELALRALGGVVRSAFALVPRPLRYQPLPRAALFGAKRSRSSPADAAAPP